MNNQNQKDYQDFKNAPSENVPSHLTEDILKFVKSDLDPSHAIVFSKLVAVQAIIGTITMLFCPQFNMSFTNSYDLFHYFHHTFGETICMLICGSIFMGSGAIIASYLLSEGEVKKIKNSKLLYYMSLTIVALSSFYFLGAQIYLNITLYWIIGALTTGLSLFHFNTLLRSKLSLRRSL